MPYSTRQQFLAEYRSLINDTLPGNRPLTTEPLEVDDWRTVYIAWLGFMAEIKAVVAVARVRAKDKGT